MGLQKGCLDKLCLPSVSLVSEDPLRRLILLFYSVHRGPGLDYLSPDAQQHPLLCIPMPWGFVTGNLYKLGGESLTSMIYRNIFYEEKSVRCLGLYSVGFNQTLKVSLIFGHLRSHPDSFCRVWTHFPHSYIPIKI